MNRTSGDGCFSCRRARTASAGGQLEQPSEVKHDQDRQGGEEHRYSLRGTFPKGYAILNAMSGGSGRVARMSEPNLELPFAAPKPPEQGRVVVSDAFELLKSLGPESVDLVVTDPPTSRCRSTARAGRPRG